MVIPKAAIAAKFSVEHPQKMMAEGTASSANNIRGAAVSGVGNCSRAAHYASLANVEQIFSRAVKFMRTAWPKHDKGLA